MKQVHREQDKKALIIRLRRIEGQMRGLQRLIAEDAPCESIAQQISAARRALDKAFHSMVGCIIESGIDSDAEPSAQMKRAIAILSRYS